MENNVQVVFSMIIATFLLFFFPIYTVFEKKDDISYFLTLRITSDFVDKVKNNGYISKKDYEKYINDLAVSGLVLDVEFEHREHKINPVIGEYNCENVDDKVKINGLNKTYEYELNKNKEDKKIFYSETFEMPDSKKFTINQMFYNDNIILKTTKDILKVLNKNPNDYVLTETMGNSDYLNYYYDKLFESIDLYKNDEVGNIYTLNKGDEFNVVIKNKTVTIPENFFNLITVNAMDKRIPRVYVNHGCIVKNERYKDFNKEWWIYKGF